VGVIAGMRGHIVNKRPRVSKYDMGGDPDTNHPNGVKAP